MKFGPESFRDIDRALFVEKRVRQLTDLLDPTRDVRNGRHLMQYETERAVPEKFWDAYTYKTKKVQVIPPIEEVARVRAHAVFTIWSELRDLGHQQEADAVIEAKTGMRPVPLNRKLNPEPTAR